MPWHSLINLTIHKITPPLIISLSELSMLFKYNEFEGEIDFNSNQSLKHNLKHHSEESIDYVVKIRRQGSLIGYGNLTIPIAKPSIGNESLLVKDFEMKMIDSTKRALLGTNNLHGVSIQVEVNARIKWTKINSLKNKNEKHHSIRNNRIKALSPKIGKNFIMLRNQYFPSSGKESLLIKTPPHNYAKHRKLFTDNQETMLNSTMKKQIKKNCASSNQWSFVLRNESSVHNHHHYAYSSLTNTNNDMAYTTDADYLLLPTPIDKCIKEKSSHFLLKYSNRDGISETAQAKTLKSMIIDTFSYIKAAKVVYKETMRVNKKIREELYSANEHYRQVIKVSNALKECKEKLHISSLITKVLPPQKGNGSNRAALNEKQKEVNALQFIFNMVFDQVKETETEKSGERRRIVEEMTNDEKSIVLLLAIKNIIGNYGKITLLTPLEYQSKLNCILRLYDITEKAFKIQKVGQINKPPYGTIRRITEQEEEEEDDKENDKKKEEEAIKRELMDNRRASKVMFRQINRELYSYGALKVKAVYENGEVKICLGEEKVSLSKFIQNNEQTEEVKMSLSKMNKNKVQMPLSKMNKNKDKMPVNHFNTQKKPNEKNTQTQSNHAN